MANKIMNARTQQKHDTSTNWALATNFTPLAGELIVYTDLNKFKLGNGTSKVTELPFANASPSSVTTTITAVADTKVYTVTHNLNSRAVMVQVYDNNTYSNVILEVTRNSVNQITLEFGEQPVVGSTYTVMIILMA